MAILLKLVAIFLFMVLAAIIKTASDHVPPGQAVFFRSFFSIPVTLAWIWHRGELRYALIPKNLGGHIWRGLFGTTAMGLTFAGLAILPLPEVTAIGYATPMFTVVLAAVLLGERVRAFRISAVVVGLVGVLIMLYPRFSVGGEDFSRLAMFGAVMVLGASILRALVQIHIRTLVKTEHTAAIVFYFALTASAISLATIPFGWEWPDLWVIGILIGSGIIGGVAQILVTASYRYGDASMLAPFDYVSMVYAAIIGYVIFAEVPSGAIWLGTSLVIVAGGLIIWRERQLGLERGRAKPFMDPKG